MAMTKDELLALIDQAAAEEWTELDLSGQGLTELPEEIGQLTQLERLILGKGKKDKDGNQEWGNTVINGEPQWGPLTIGNELTELPVWLTHLTNLCHLDLSGNFLKNMRLYRILCKRSIIRIHQEIAPWPVRKKHRTALMTY